MEVRPDPAGLERLFVDAPEYDARLEVWGRSPVQALGAVLGRELYFRAKHDGWTFDVADHAGRLPSDGSRNADGFHRAGDCPDAGWMPHRKAVSIIERCLREYAGG